jgi:hypothetical protein
MYAKVVTTITTEIDLDTMEPSHDVRIECNDPIPHDLAKAIAIGAAKSLLVSIDNEEEESTAVDPNATGGTQ